MGGRDVLLAGALLVATFVAAAEVEIANYGDGALEFTVKGSGTATVMAQADFKYISDKTGVDGLARATSNPFKVKLTETPIPVNITFDPPDGSVTEVEIVVFVNGEEKARRTFGF